MFDDDDIGVAREQQIVLAVRASDAPIRPAALCHHGQRQDVQQGAEMIG